MRRLTFSFRDGTIDLVSQQRVDMRTPAGTGPKTLEARADFWYELLDDDANVLYRFAASDPIPTDVEVFSDDPERTVERAPHPPKEGVFTVLVPEIDDATEVLLRRSSQKRDAESATEIHRFRLTYE